MKKFFSLVLALVMALSLTTVAWGASTYTVGTSGTHATLAEAVAAAQAGDTIELLDKVTVSSDLEITKAVTIDAKGLEDAITITGGTLTLGAGVTVTSNAYAVFYVNGGKLLVAGADITHTGASGALIAVSGENSVMTVSSGAVHSATTVISVSNKATLNITGGSVYNENAGDKAAVAVKSGATANVSGNAVVYSNTSSAIAVNAGTLKIEGGNIYSAATGDAPKAAAYSSNGGEIVVNGGTLTAANSAALVASKHEGTSGGKVTVKGGTVAGVLAHQDSASVVTVEGGNITGDVAAEEGATVEIKGGTVTGDVTEEAGSTVTVYAGTFPNADVLGYLANGSVYKDGVVTKQTATPTTGTTSTGSVTSGTVTPSKPTLYKLAAVGGSMMKDDENIDEIKLTTTSGRLQNDVPLYVPNIYKVDNFYYIQVAKADADYALYNNGAWIYLFRTPYGSDAAAITAYATSVVMDAKVSPADEDIDCGDCLKGGQLATYYVSGDDVYYAGGNTWAYFNGEFVKYDKDTDVAFKGHVWDATTVTYRATDVKGHQVSVSIECEDCEKTFKVVPAYMFDNTWVKFVDYVDYPYANGYYIVLESATSAPVVTPSTDSDKVTSAETFDAGIAMYVGMSVMAAAGSAVVIGKKKD